MEEAAGLERQSRIFKPTILFYNHSDDRMSKHKTIEGPTQLPVWKKFPLNRQQLNPWLQASASHPVFPEMISSKKRAPCSLGCTQVNYSNQGVAVSQQDIMETDAGSKGILPNLSSPHDGLSSRILSGLDKERISQSTNELFSNVDSMGAFDRSSCAPSQMFGDSKSGTNIRKNVYMSSDNTECITQKRFVKESRKHTGKKRYNCPFCAVTCSNMGQLRGHLRCHTGERPFICSFKGCSRKFARNEELTRHKRIHSGVRPFTCGSCKKSFGRKDHLQKHEKTHLNPNEKKAYACPVCKQGYSRSDALARHKVTAHSDQYCRTQK